MKNLRPILSTGMTPAFDYDLVKDADVVRQLREAADQIRDLQDVASIGIGRALLAVKDKLEHGQFLNWVEAEFAFGRRTAVRMMQVATEFGDKWDSVSHLPTTVLYKLAAPSTPPSVREAVLNLNPGEVVTPRSVQSAIDAVKQADVRKDRRDRFAERRQEQEEHRAKWEARDEKEREHRERQREAARVAAEKVKSMLGLHFYDLSDTLSKVDPYHFSSELVRLAQQCVDEGGDA